MRAIIRDSGLPALTYSPNSREVTIGSEGGTAIYTIVPASEPSSDLTVALSSSDRDSVTVASPSLTFTVGASGNWETPQTVTVTGVADADEFDDLAYIRHRTTVDGEEYSWASVEVTVSDSNRAPFFEEGLDTTRYVAESAGQGANVGDPITATDLNTGDTLTYSLDDQNGKFAINNTTGQITVAADDSLDYETEQDYSVEVVVSVRTTDGLTDKIEVKVLVTDVNEPPEVSGDDSPTFKENANINNRLARYTATDPERDSVEWSVDGTDKDAFTIDTSGDLKFSSQPDHEAKDEYSIIIVATDDGESQEKGELPVTVSVEDFDERPAITGDDALTFPENTAATAVLQTYTAADPEGVTTTFTWSLSGSDSGDFEISDTGELIFENARRTPAATTSMPSGYVPPTAA